jgi:hypothetical protein
MEYGAEMVLCGMVYAPSFMNIDAGVQTILRFSLGNLRACNAGIVEGRGLLLRR